MAKKITKKAPAEKQAPKAKAKAKRFTKADAYESSANAAIAAGREPPNPPRAKYSQEEIKQETINKMVNKSLNALADEQTGKPKPKYSREEIKQAVADAGAKRREELAQRERERNVGAPHGIVRARAGTGKTFTMIVGVLWAAVQWALRTLVGNFAQCWARYAQSSLGFVPTPSEQQLAIWKFIAREPAKQVRYLAFNKSIVEEFGEKYKQMVGLLQGLGVYLSFSTLHSLGFQACRRAYRLNGWKAVTSWKSRDLLSALWEVDLQEVEKEKGETIDAICELVRLCKITLAGKCGSADSLGETQAPRKVGQGRPGTVAEGRTAWQVDGKADTWRGECVTDEELDQLATHYEVLLNGNREEVFRDVRLLLDMAREQTDRIDYEDMLWLPIVNNLPLETYDLLMVDEGQDLNRCQQELVLRVGKRIVLVGDECQAIYGFAGADVESIDRMQELLGGSYPMTVEEAMEHEAQGGKIELKPYTFAVVHSTDVFTPLELRQGGRGVEEYRLTVTRRCGKAIVREAQVEVPEFEAYESNPDGEVLRVQYDEAYEAYGRECRFIECSMEVSTDRNLPPGEIDMVLCRTNAPLVGVAFAMLREGRRCNIKGRDLGEGLKRLVKKSKAKNVSEFLDWLDKFQQLENERLAKRRQPDPEAAITLADKCECLRMFAEGAMELEEMYAAIDKVFALRKPSDKHGPEPKPEGTLLSSIHRAKGLEAKRVFLLRPDLLPHPMAKTEWARGQEKNLSYVAKTRAIGTLVYVDGQRKGGE